MKALQDVDRLGDAESMARAVDEVSETAALEEEIERLRQRVADLESTVAEYRHQVTQILTSASWQATSPIRAAASRYRTAKVRARRAAKRIRRRNSTKQPKVLITGLFMPPLESLPETSPLRVPLDANALRRSPDADGPLTRPEGSPRILVVAHVHYPELWGDIEDRLVRMPEAYDLICTVTEGTAESAIPRIMARHPHARIEVVPNRGRDWAPLVRLANKGLLSGYDAIAKVHTKRSEHRIDGDRWRLELLDGILESPEQIRRTIDLLREDRSVGMVVPNGHIAGTEHWGSDQPIVEALAARLPMAFDSDELRFPAGSMFWCRPWLLERLADLAIADEHFEPEAGQYDATTAHALERLIGVFAHVSGMDLVEAADTRRRLSEARKSPTPRPKVYAFYLPQYHQCPENDEFWGEGFTDWANVRKAKPLFEGHRQPLQPHPDLGYYDLKDPEVLRRQAKLAKDHGVDGFVFHYYWFDGRKVLDTPLSNWLADPTIDLPLALCWANEPWTRRWDGLEHDVLIEQAYGEDWANRFWDDISPVLKDPRYITMDESPVLVIYRLSHLPDARGAIETWRERAADDGHPALRLLAVAPSRDFEALEPELTSAVDGLVAFPPGSNVTLTSIREHVAPRQALQGDVFSYDAAFPAPSQLRLSTFPAVMPGWDNTARRNGSAHVFHGSNACTWRRHIATATHEAQGYALFVNAWNEWAEGATLEPTTQEGFQMLSSLRDAAFQTGAKTRREGRP